MSDYPNGDEVDLLPPSAATLGDGYSDPADSGTTVLDLDHKGVDDAVVV